MTTYANKEQFEKREEHFQELIKEKGGLELMNEKKPAASALTKSTRTLFTYNSTIHPGSVLSFRV